jgi:EpsI family protein
MELEGWSGSDVPVEPRIVRALGVSDYLSRTYEDIGHPAVFLYVGYYKSQRMGEFIHSPKNCLPGAGWEPVSTGHTVLTTPGGKRVLVNQYIVENGLHRQLVLYWYQSHGRIVASEYLSKIYMVLDALRLNRTDAALVRISTPITGTDQNGSIQRSVAFAEKFLARSEGLIPN